MMNREIRTHATDLNATVFQDKVVWLPALIMARLQAGQGVVEGRTFNNCLLQGPAVFLALQAVELDSCNLGWTGGDLRNLVLRPASTTSVIGTVPFKDCRIFECDFDAVGFTGAESFLQSILSLPGTDS